MLADIRRSVAALAAPASDVPTQALPIAQGVAPGASAVTEQGQAARAHPGASQDLTTQTLVSVSQMLANLTVPVPTPHPTTPWASDPLQNSVLELKRQVEALVATRNVPSLQVATSGPSVSQAPGPLSQTPPGGKEHEEQAAGRGPNLRTFGYHLVGARGLRACTPSGGADFGSGRSRARFEDVPSGHEDFERSRKGGSARAQFTEVRAFRLGGKLKKELAADPGAHCFRKKR
ncbi:hypothetical protein NDU88_005841 [Pleurodeles waltl]|uniref:Uncharacterized protein n=1 Tax=Pleurodeles waltl TaxID=8319 RepID=A0AAV7PHZ7_PLEWA|nr:hypothetical protein NDU88_005841 [Pleurodeles waltl]